MNLNNKLGYASCALCVAVGLSGATNGHGLRLLTICGSVSYCAIRYSHLLLILDNGVLLRNTIGAE